MTRVYLAFCLIFALTACGASAKPDYPSHKPEAYVGKKADAQKAAPAPRPQGDGEVCVGAWCSCASE